MFGKCKRYIALIAVTALMLSSCAAATGFKDVSERKWYAPFVRQASSYGLFEGDTDGNFRPADPITRAEVAAVLARVVSADTAAYRNRSTSFTDVRSSKWYAGAVKWAVAGGVASGQSKTIFAPEANITRQELCVMLARFMKNFGLQTATDAAYRPFADESAIASWAKSGVRLCQQLSLVSGKDAGRFDPKGNTTRAEGARILSALTEKTLLPICKLRIHYLDVGQGDSIFIELPDGGTMLIDAGEARYADGIAKYIKALGYTKIDYIVGTHPHADHIGGLADVIKTFSVGKVYLPRSANTTQTYENLLTTIQSKGLTVRTAKAGVDILTAAGLKVYFIAPVRDDYGDKDYNLYSACVRITYGGRAFLFMGDATTQNEAEITEDVSADVIKVGHHGSKTSSSAAFVKRVEAKYAVVSVGRDNKYNLPAAGILKRWTDSGAKLYRTDESGTIICYSDGNYLMMKADAPSLPEDSPAAYILNTNSKKIHLATCSYAASISDANRASTRKSLDELKAEGYTCCGVCLKGK